MNKSTRQIIEQLHPEIRQRVFDGVVECDAALKGRAKVVLVYGFRSDSLQNSLYAKGRTVVNLDGKSKQRPFGYKVTNAKGGQSIHNYYLAFDIALLLDGVKYSWDDLKDYDGDGVADWMECVRIFKTKGFVWGGDWSSFIDKPHFEDTFGLTLKQIQGKRAAKDFIRGTNCINLRNTAAKTFEVLTALNLRSGAGTGFPVIVVLPAKSKVVYIAAVGEWTKVSFGPKIGFVSTKYLKQIAI